MNEAAKLIDGKNGWLFLHNDSNGVVLQHTGLRQFTGGELILWRRTLEMRDAYCKAHNASYRMVVAPDTHALYPEFLPDDIVPVPHRPIHQLLDHLNNYSNMRLIYPLEAMKEAKEQAFVGQMTDSHWSHYGAFVAYRKLMATFPNDIRSLNFDDVVISNTVSIGDLGEKIPGGKEGCTTSCKLKKVYSHQVWCNDVSNRGNISVWRHQDQSLPVGLFCSDSYGYHWQAYLAQSFSTLVCVHSPLLELDLLERYRPNVVISLLSERFIKSVPDDLRGERAVRLAQQKKPEAGLPWEI
jgi:hypothetical protein